METNKLRWPDFRDLAFILGLLVVTRIALTAIGIFMHAVWLQQPLVTPDDFANIWNVWDGRLYIDIARDGYSALPLNEAGMANYAFFPLYPLLMGLVASVVGNYALAGLLVSNICLLVACVYIYRYVSLDEDSDQGTARRAVKYLILFPMAFLFSAVLTESLFVMLSIACLYYARRGNWLIAGLLGFFVPLTRLPGLAILVPLAYEYLRQHWSGRADTRLPEVRALLKPGMFALLLPILGLGTWAVYNYYLTGDLLGFIHVQSTWGGRFALPPIELLTRLIPANGYVFTGAVFTVAAIVLMILFYKKVDFGGWMFGIMLICIPLFSVQSGYSMLRYLVVVFPLCIIAARVAKDRRIDIGLTVALIILQVVLMALWTCWSPLIV
jgi:Gpi18-like mannosyltransferase